MLSRAEAEEAEKVAVVAHDAAQARVDAWQAVEPVLAHQLATAEAQRLRRVVDAEQERARPALRARQAAAAALAAGLQATIAEAEAAAATAAGEAAAAEERAGAARDRELQQAKEAAGHAAVVDAAHAALGRSGSASPLRTYRPTNELLAGPRTTRAAARPVPLPAAAGLTSGPHAGPTTGRRSSSTSRPRPRRPSATPRDAAAALAAAAEELTALRRARQAADAGRSAAQRAADEAAAAAAQADAAHREAATVRDALAAESRLGELLGVEEIVPDTDAAGLVERLTAAVASAEHERTGLLADQARDRRALRALGEGGLLPEPAEIEEVLRVLEAAGITAYSGWRYLAKLPAAERGAVVDRLPHLVGGVLLNSAGDAARARTELTAARLLPCATVAVGTTAAIATDAIAPGVELVVPPNPAMVDEEAAAQVRAELSDATRARAATIERLVSGQDHDRELLARVRAWRDRRPTLDELADAAEAAHARRAETAATAAAADDEVADLDARAEDLEADRPRRAAAAAATQERAATLARAGGRDRAGARAARPHPRGGGRRRARRRASRGRARGRRTGPRGRRRGPAPPGPAARASPTGRGTELAELPLDADPVVRPETRRRYLLPAHRVSACCAVPTPRRRPPTRPPRWAPTSPGSWRWPSGTPAPR